MKKIISTCIALMVSAACSISAFAMEVPTNTTIQDLNGVRQYIKIYTVALDTDPQSLIDDVFEYDGYTYTYSSMTKEEQSYSEKEHHTETVTADTEKSDLSVVLKALSPSIEYDDGEFRGTLYLDHSTISTVASGYTTKSYTVSATKEIDNLDTNDMAYVPDTTTKNGVTVQLQSVDWQVQGTSLVDDILVPAQYKAVATYAGRASYRAATGYVTTAKYIGDIVAEGIESVTYTVIYTGTPSSILQRVVAKSTENFPIILIFLVVIALAITAVVLIWRTAVCSFSIAVDRDFKSKNGEKETDFIDIVAWRATAEFVSKYFTKGRMAVVEGRLQIRDWTDKEGGKRRSAEVIADNVYFGDSKPKDGGEEDDIPAYTGAPDSFAVPDGFTPDFGGESGEMPF